MSQNQIVGPEAAGQTGTRENHKTSRKSHVATSALASALAASLATQAQAQDAQSTVTSTNQLANGDLQLVLSDGRTVVVNAADYQIVDGQIVLSQSVVADLNLAGAETVAAEGGVGSLPAILGGVVALGAAGGGGGSSGDNGLSFSSGPVASVAENQTAAYNAVATDIDGETVTYSLSGRDAALFEIDSSTGEVTFRDAPDFEAPGDANGNNAYDIVVRAAAGGRTTNQNVTITVTNENDNLPVFSSGTTASVAENQTAAYTAVATDADGDAVTYSLSGTDAALFEIDSATGVVTFIAAPDFEAPGDSGGNNTYDVEVVASSGGASISRAVTITVTNENDNTPTFSSDTTASVIENQTAAYTAVATDADGDAVTYSLSGTDAALFEIDSTTGAVTFVSAPDFEAPSDAGGDNVYDVVVTATAGGQTVDQNVAITVTNMISETVDLSTLTQTQGIIIEGAAFSDRLGSSVSSAGDVNGDGFDDFIVGSPNSDNGGGVAGDAYVFYGSATGANIDISTLTNAQGFRIQGDEAFDRAGYSVSSAGDVNGDGFDDLIVGAPFANGTEGEAYVIYGSATGVDIDLSSLTSAQGFVFIGDRNADFAGISVSSAGDVNGDGFDDLIVGARAANLGTGAAYVIFGGETGTNIDLGTLTSEQGFIIQGDEAGDRAGTSVSSAGDVNGDGFDDLIIAADRGDDGGTDAGEAYVIYGNATGANVDLSSLTPAQGFIIQGDMAGDLAGTSVSSAGDVNGDGFDDLIVGAYVGDDGGTSAGEAYVIYGSASGSNIDLTTLTPEQGFIIQGDTFSDFAGDAVSSAGDVNGDGFDDLLIGAQGGDDGGNNAGEAYVVYGSAAGTNVDLSTLTQAQGFIIQGDVANSRIAVSVSSAGDVNGDGFDDLIIGAPFDVDDGVVTGRAFVIYGGATETESTEVVSQTGTAAADNFTGNAGADSFSNIGTDDVVRGGAGDDVITITSLDFADVDGGHGTDSLILDGAGLNLDLTGARTDVENFELIDLTGTGDNSLTLDRLSLLDLSEDTSGGITTFTVRGDAGDAVILNDLSDWTSSGQRDVDGDTFDVFTNGAAELLVDDAVSVISIAV
ncbi:hypothetical protein [Rhodovulum sp. FJ3]|uniref:beta strand repeat-containing protein n=1 Tax=Rhodovulum sp. FJ3 TaxID=3079053 RepID=UPI00293DF425|nr:hypothetical protein [Rhodovulum sp. FJ3]MDV4169267.1 hypothetical protein [Rhodovulum sp. FJ3]